MVIPDLRLPVSRVDPKQLTKCAELGHTVTLGHKDGEQIKQERFAAGGTSLFCWAVVVLPRDQALLRGHLMPGRDSLLGCDASLVVSQYAVSAPDALRSAGHACFMDMSKGAQSHGFGGVIAGLELGQGETPSDASLAKQGWRAILRDGRYASHTWTVFHAVDTVFLSTRLRAKLDATFGAITRASAPSSRVALKYTLPATRSSDADAVRVERAAVLSNGAVRALSRSGGALRGGAPTPWLESRMRSLGVPFTPLGGVHSRPVGVERCGCVNRSIALVSLSPPPSRQLDIDRCFGAIKWANPAKAHRCGAPRGRTPGLLAGWRPRLPPGTVLGQVTSVAIDPEDGAVWCLTRQTAGPLQTPVSPGGATLYMSSAGEALRWTKPVLAFDAESGELLREWGGPGAGYDWPDAPHGIHVASGRVWIAGGFHDSPPPLPNKTHDRMVLSFDRQGNFVKQMGRPFARTEGNGDTENLNRPCSLAVDARANEVFVADGYGNSRVVVLDADSLAYKRHWVSGEHQPHAPPRGDQKDPLRPFTFMEPHALALAEDGALYVCDKKALRLHAFVARSGRLIWSKDMPCSGLALSAPPAQRHLYVTSRWTGPKSEQHDPSRLHVLERAHGEVVSVTTFDRGRDAGQFEELHGIGVTKEGSIFLSDIRWNRSPWEDLQPNDYDAGRGSLQKFAPPALDTSAPANEEPTAAARFERRCVGGEARRRPCESGAGAPTLPPPSKYPARPLRGG